MSRITIFAKGNVDVKDSLHFSRVGGEVQWNGINEILQRREPKCRARIIHETAPRAEALQRATGAIPDIFAGRDLALGAYPLESQFSAKAFDTDADVLVLSIQSDVHASLYRHRSTGALLYPNDLAAWSTPDRAWLASEFEGLQPAGPDDFLAAWTAIIDRVREKKPDQPILIYNVSASVPGEQVHCHLGLEDIFSTRVRRLNLALIELSQITGISIIDVDAIVAKYGADATKHDYAHLTAAGYRYVAEEVVRVLEDIGVV